MSADIITRRDIFGAMVLLQWPMLTICGMEARLPGDRGFGTCRHGRLTNRGILVRYLVGLLTLAATCTAQLPDYYKTVNRVTWLWATSTRFGLRGKRLD